MISYESRNNNSDIKDANKWVKKLQQESWELELLVSGFSILLLTKLTGILETTLDNIINGLNVHLALSGAIMLFLMFVILSSYALIINLVIHLIFRGFWVGIVGLGSVAPTTEFPKLKYSKFFTKKLEKKITKLDELVIVIDKISSLIFTFAFLIIFFLISIGLFIISIVFFEQFASLITGLTEGVFKSILKNTFNGLLILFLISGIIYLIDFLTLGFFKKYNRLSKIYYPIYTLFGWITLSFLYRTLYYNLISKFSKRKVGLILIPYLLVLIIVPLSNFDHHIYFPDKSIQSHINNDYYSDLRKADSHVQEIDIPSYIIRDNFLPIFISYKPIDNKLIKKAYPDLEPLKNEGYNSELKISNDADNFGITDIEIEKDQKEMLKSMAALYEIYLNDSLTQNPDFYFKTHVNNKEKGLFTVIDIIDLPRGKNILKLKRVMFDGDKQTMGDLAIVPFWKE